MIVFDARSAAETLCSETGTTLIGCWTRTGGRKRTGGAKRTGCRKRTGGRKLMNKSPRDYNQQFSELRALELLMLLKHNA